MRSGTLFRAFALAVAIAPGVYAFRGGADTNLWSVSTEAPTSAPEGGATTEGREGSSWTMALGGLAAIALRLAQKRK